MKAYGQGMVWDAETNSVLVTFKKGEAEVSDEVARKLSKLGYKVDGEVPAEAEPEVSEVESETSETELAEAKSRRRK